jgi:hypothetical protein
MKLSDTVEMKGHFSVQVFKKDGTIETYEEKNLIMDKARSNMAELVGGYNHGKPIDKFVLGNKGHVGTDILDYKLVGENNEFVSSRTRLFAQDPGYDNSNSVDSFAYAINFDVKSSGASALDNSAAGSIEGDSATQNCTVSRVVSDRSCTYVITIPDYAGNKVGEGAVIAYTEAALYAGVDIFSMKTFPARVKEDTVKFVITWSIIF